jgi:hypothetical protein
MRLKELSPRWPPAIFDERSHVKADLQDVVTSVQNKGDGTIEVMLRKPSTYGVEYAVTLNVPADVFQQTLLSIVRRAGITLGEVGEIKVQ